jgi:hypothetical protein
MGKVQSPQVSRRNENPWTTVAWILLQSPSRILRIVQVCTAQTFPFCHNLHRMSQEERSIFWEIIVSVILRKNVCMNMCPIPNGFRDRAIWMYSCKMIDKKAILRTVSNIQVTNLLVYNKFSKIPRSTSVHFASRMRTWRVARLSSSWRSFMRAITSIMRSNSSPHVSTFLLYTSLVVQPHKQKSNGIRSGDLGGQLIVLTRPIHR